MNPEQPQAQQKDDSLSCLLSRLRKEKDAGWLLDPLSMRDTLHEVCEDIPTKLCLDASV